MIRNISHVTVEGIENSINKAQDKQLTTAMMLTGILLFLFSVCVRMNTLIYNDCDDVLHSGKCEESGVYLVYLNRSEPLEVYCNFESGGAKVQIMQQKYGHENFNRTFRDYEYGFGDVTRGDFWVGLSRMKSLTNAGYNVLTVTMQDCSHNIKTIRYNYFMLGPASDSYRLHIGGYVSEYALPDDFSHNNGMPFATIDRPDRSNCPLHQRGGWWYNYCSFTLPTGHYYAGCYYTPSADFYDGIYYKDWHGFGYSYKYIRMELSRY